MSEQTVGAGAVAVPGPNGGKLMPPWAPGQSGNPAGGAPRRERLARELARCAGSRELVALVERTRRYPGALAEALWDMALNSPLEFARLGAQNLIWKLLGMSDPHAETDTARDIGARARAEQIQTAMRSMLGTTKTIDVQQVAPETNGNGHANGSP